MSARRASPACECYEACSGGWDVFVNGNLRRGITTGEVPPNPFGGRA